MFQIFFLPARLHPQHLCFVSLKGRLLPSVVVREVDFFFPCLLRVCEEGTSSPLMAKNEGARINATTGGVRLLATRPQ
jgi:hypothetical protein